MSKAGRTRRFDGLVRTTTWYEIAVGWEMIREVVNIRHMVAYAQGTSSGSVNKEDYIKSESCLQDLRPRISN